MNDMIEPQNFTSQKDLLKWLRKGGVKWTKKQLAYNLQNRSFSTDWKYTHVYVKRIGLRRYYVDNLSSFTSRYFKEKI